MSLPDYVPVNPRKSTTTIQDGSVYKEEFFLPGSAPSGATTSIQFKNAGGTSVTATINGTVSGNTVSFENPYSQVSSVKNGATFYCYVTVSSVKHLIAYGTTFRRQLTFPSAAGNTLDYTDDFQRPAGQVGNRWETLVGRPEIFDNTGFFGNDKPNTVGPRHDFFSRYFMRFYQPFVDDKINLSFGLSDKGEGHTVVAICGSLDMSSYLYAHFYTTLTQNYVKLGIGTGPDIGNDIQPVNLTSMSSEVQATVSKDGYLTQFRLKYNENTKKLSLTNYAGTYEHVSWTDTSNIAPHGRGYRYFGIGGRASLANSGIQVGYISASATGI